MVLYRYAFLNPELTAIAIVFHEAIPFMSLGSIFVK